jgi:hypothetical protein
VVGLCVVGQDTLDDDALRLVPGCGALEEADAAVGVLACDELRVGEARVVVDRDPEVLPADPPIAEGRPAC